MINRSVRGYAAVVAMACVLAAQHARPDSTIYDLGCSWGASLLSAARKVDYPSCQLSGIENSEAMLKRARLNFQEQLSDQRVVLQASDIMDIQLENASVVILNYTLQFVPIKHRETLLRRIRSAMQPGDVLILSEKLTLPDPQLNDYLIELHHNFKRQQGYSDIAISHKRQALQDVMIPETRPQHVEPFHPVAFRRCHISLHCLTFPSLLAIP